MITFSGAIWLPLIGAALHPLLGLCVQKTSREGTKPTLITCLSNLVTISIFLLYLRPTGGWSLQAYDFLAIANGFVFFLGQWFSVQSVKSGDIAVHSSALGLKMIVVASLSLFVGLENPSWNLLGGVILAVIAVFLVAGASLDGWRKHRVTVGLTICACLFFGLNDFLTGWKSPETGGARWLVLMMGTSGLLSVFLLIPRRIELQNLVKNRPALTFLLLAALAFGIQALAVNIAFTRFNQPTLSNIVYSTRGLLAVLFLWWLHRKIRPQLRKSQLAGALLMILSLALVLVA